MIYNPEIHHRRSIRLAGYDYSQPGAYFVTICTQKRECLFGEIINGYINGNEYGKIVEQCWFDLPNHYTRRINEIRNTPGIPVWQRNYYEHIIRDNESLHRIADYIKNNPKSWNKDDYYDQYPQKGQTQC